MTEFHVAPRSELSQIFPPWTTAAIFVPSLLVATHRHALLAANPDVGKEIVATCTGEPLEPAPLVTMAVREPFEIAWKRQQAAARPKKIREANKVV